MFEILEISNYYLYRYVFFCVWKYEFFMVFTKLMIDKANLFKIMIFSRFYLKRYALKFLVKLYNKLQLYLINCYIIYIWNHTQKYYKSEYYFSIKLLI